jgi:hypothetical protein
MLTALFSSGWLHILGQVEFPLLVLIVPQTLAFLLSSVSANLTVFQTWLDRCDDSGLSFCLRVIKLSPPTFAPRWLCHVSDITRYHLTHHSDQHYMFCYFPWIAHPKSQVTLPWDCGFITWLFFGL